MNIEYKLIPLTKENIILLEKIRFNAYQMKENIIPLETTYHAKQLSSNKYLVFGCFIDNQLIGACYISNSLNSLYVEQLFILKEYQHTKLHLGTNLLKYVLANKNVIEEYFNTKLNYSCLDNNNKSYNLCKLLGYEEIETIMKKRI